MPANRGIADIIADIGGWNQTYVITVSANMLGPVIALVNPATGEWGTVFDTYQTFVDHKMTFAGAGKSVWNKVSGEFYMVRAALVFFSWGLTPLTSFFSYFLGCRSPQAEQLRWYCYLRYLQRPWSYVSPPPRPQSRFFPGLID
jgi:hypothetical protein